MYIKMQNNLEGHNLDLYMFFVDVLFVTRYHKTTYLSLRFSKNRAKDALRACGTAVEVNQK